jgi:hypothetical protein
MLGREHRKNFQKTCPSKSPHPYFLPSANARTVVLTATIPGIRNAFYPYSPGEKTAISDAPVSDSARATARKTMFECDIEY